MERLQERYLRWVLGVKRNTLGYIVTEELDRDKLKVKARMRTWKYDRKLEES